MDKPHDDSYQRWLYGDPITVEEANALIASCLTCSECPEPRVAPHDHHWLDMSMDSDDPDDLAAFQLEHPQVEATDELMLAHEACKHCPAVRAMADDDDVFGDAEIDPATLDPGIRELVMELRRRGFHTTDSGDGVSKPAAERVIDRPHVIIALSPQAIATSARRLAEALAAIAGKDLVVPCGGRGWSVEASYDPCTRVAIAMVIFNAEPATSCGGSEVGCALAPQERGPLSLDRMRALVGGLPKISIAEIAENTGLGVDEEVGRG